MQCARKEAEAQPLNEHDNPPQHQYVTNITHVRMSSDPLLQCLIRRHMQYTPLAAPDDAMRARMRTHTTPDIHRGGELMQAARMSSMFPMTVKCYAYSDTQTR